jgi:hypothetical protein
MSEKRILEITEEDFYYWFYERMFPRKDHPAPKWDELKPVGEPLPVAPETCHEEVIALVNSGMNEPAAPTPELEELTIDEIKGILLWTHDNYGREEIVLLNTDNGSSTNLADELGGYEGCLIDVHAYYPPEPKPAPGPGDSDSNGGGA